jgi:hypothetical protein
MPDDAFLDSVRKSAFPTPAPEGPVYEVACVRGWLAAIARHTAGKKGSGLAIQASRDEAARVFRACWNATFARDIEDCTGAGYATGRAPASSP